MFAKRGPHAPYIPPSGRVKISLKHVGMCFGVVLLVVSILQLLHPLLARHKPSSKLDALDDAALSERICFVVRTYWRHGAEGDNSLTTLLDSLRRSKHQRWQALALVMDGRAFHDLQGIVKSYNDKRIKVFAEMTGPEFSLKDERGVVNPNFHNHLYVLTDLAIRGCAQDTTWVVVTNGDNVFDAAFMPTLIDTPDTADLVAFDYHSRYQRPTAPPCERFAESEGVAACKENSVRFCQTDLTANAFRWARFVKEQHQFGSVDGASLGLNDAIVVDDVVTKAGWQVHHVKSSCLVHHAPNPQLCATEGGVWDDSGFTVLEHAGGECIRRAEAEARMENAQLAPLEMITVNLTHDHMGSLGLPTGRLTIQCLRRPFSQPYTPTFFPPSCASRFDGGQP